MIAIGTAQCDMLIRSDIYSIYFQFLNLNQTTLKYRSIIFFEAGILPKFVI